jgi:hypothetical protein
MTTAGENKSIWFDPERLTKIEQIIAAYERQTGLRISRSAVVSRAIDELFLLVCPVDTSNGMDGRQPTAEAA